MWKIILGALIIIFIIFVIRRINLMRKKVIARKLKDVDLPEIEERKLWHLAKKVVERAGQEGVFIPSNIFVCRLDDDPYTWVILKLGFKDKEIYRCRISIEDITNCQKIAEEEMEMEKEEV